MSTIVTRIGKGSALTWIEADANFTNLNTDKYQSGNSPTFNAITATSITVSGTATINSLVATGVSISGTATINAIAITNLTLSGTGIMGDPGTESGGIDIAGTTYQSTFKVSDIDGTHYAQTILHRHSTSLESVIVGARANSNTSTHADVTNTMNIITLYGVGYAGSNYKMFGSVRIRSDTTGTISNTSAPGSVVIATTPAGSTTPVDAVTINNAGLVSLTKGQIAFPATQVPSSDVNTLDDYEEGTWTPADGSGAGLSFTGVSGNYVKIGKVVYFSGTLTYPATANGSSAVISGLPFTSHSGSRGSAQMGYCDESTLRAGIVNTSATTINFYNFSGTAVTNATLSGNVLTFDGAYIAAA